MLSNHLAPYHDRLHHEAGHIGLIPYFIQGSIAYDPASSIRRFDHTISKAILPDYFCSGT